MLAAMTDADLHSQFQSLFPWPDAWAQASRRHELLKRYEVAAPPSDIWHLLSDTSRLNRQLRIPPSEFSEINGARNGRAAYLGLEQTWREPPWEWVQEKLLICTKEYSKGPARAFRAAFYLEPNGESTFVWVYYGFTAWGPIGHFMVRRFRRFLETAYGRLMPRIEQHLALGSIEESPLIRPQRGVSPERIQKANALKQELLKHSKTPALAEKLVHHIVYSDGSELYRLRLKALSKKWDTPFPALLETALHATRVGILTLSWEVICPHCRGTRLSLARLSDIPNEASCEACDIVFGTDAPNRIEVIFKVHPRVREIRNIVYCAAEVASKPHVWFQQHVEPNHERSFSLNLRPGLYCARQRSSEELLTLRIEETAPSQIIRLPEQLGEELVCGSELRVELKNPSSLKATYLLEAIAWEDDHVHPGDILSQHEFRDIFTEETIASEVILQVGEQTIVFTDMVQSTALYQTLGDSSAFQVVKEHFDVIFSTVKEGRGAVIKTIGDSVMAAFNDPVDALKAAIDVHGRLDKANLEIAVRISMHQGPCLAVNLNTGMDYFGSVVNEAAKLQSLVEGRQIVLSEQLVSQEAIQTIFAENGLEPARVQFRSTKQAPYQMVGVLTLESSQGA